MESYIVAIWIKVKDFIVFIQRKKINWRIIYETKNEEFRRKRRRKDKMMLELRKNILQLKFNNVIRKESCSIRWKSTKGRIIDVSYMKWIINSM
jgi:hypothetical protein